MRVGVLTTSLLALLWGSGAATAATAVDCAACHEELAKAKCSDGGKFLLMLMKKELDEEILDEFVDFKSTHAVAWGGKPMQPLARCVEHMVTSIIRTIIDEVSSASGSVVPHLSIRDASAWAKVKLCED